MIDPRRGCLKKENVDFRINEETLLKTEKPVDFSFKKLTVLQRKFEKHLF